MTRIVPWNPSASRTLEGISFNISQEQINGTDFDIDDATVNHMDVCGTSDDKPEDSDDECEAVDVNEIPEYIANVHDWHKFWRICNISTIYSLAQGL